MCDHPQTEARKMFVADGSIRVVLQCLHCGSATVQRKKAGYDVDALPLFDLDLRNAHDRKVREEHNTRVECARALGKRKAEYFWEAYAAYLKSDGWHEKRDAVMRRARGLCEARIDGCEEYATQVHHLTYDNCPAKHADRSEPLWDLKAVCQSCHDKITEWNRSGGSLVEAG